MDTTRPRSALPGAGGDPAALIPSVVLGTWLFLSAFVWPHSPAQFTNTWVTGLCIVAVAVAGRRVPAVRYLNAVLALWLFVSAFVLPGTTTGTAWNSVLVAIGLLVFALLPFIEGSAGRLPRTT
jgi:hypothetical protein